MYFISSAWRDNCNRRPQRINLYTQKCYHLVNSTRIGRKTTFLCLLKRNLDVMHWTSLFWRLIKQLNPFTLALLNQDSFSRWSTKPRFDIRCVLTRDYRVWFSSIVVTKPVAGSGVRKEAVRRHHDLGIAPGRGEHKGLLVSTANMAVCSVLSIECIRSIISQYFQVLPLIAANGILDTSCNHHLICQISMPGCNVRR